MGIVQAEEPVFGKEGSVPPLTPSSRAASIRSGQIRGSTHDHSWCGSDASWVSPARVALAGTAAGLGPAKFGHCVSIFLHPLAPPALPGFIATMGAVTPARPTGLLTSRACPGEGRGLPASRNRPSEPSVSNHRPAPMVALTPRPSPGQALTPQRHRLPHLRAGSGLHLCVAGSPDGTAESSFSSYGWLFRLLLLSTPPRGDAVTVGYRPE